MDGRKRKCCMKIYQENGPLITLVNCSSEWGILMNILAETLMDFRGLMEDLALAKEIKREGCC